MDTNGYLNLKLQKADGRKKEIIAFASLEEGKNALFRITSEHELCQKFTGLYQTSKECFQFKIKECDGACIGKISPLEYNERVTAFVQKHLFESENMVIIDKGRTTSERSAVLIENGIYRGYAFYELNFQINTIEILKNILIPMQNNRDTKTIIQSHIRRSKTVKIRKF